MKGYRAVGVGDKVHEKVQVQVVRNQVMKGSQLVVKAMGSLIRVEENQFTNQM